MSVEALGWALHVPVGGNMKVILLGLANHAHADGSESYPVLDTLAGYAACDRSTVRRNLRKLVAEGWVIEDGTGPRGQTKYRLPLSRRSEGGGKVPPVANGGPEGGARASEGVAPMPPEPSKEPTTNRPLSREGAQARDARRMKMPADFPDELLPAARHVFRVLRAVAAEHPGAKAVWPREIGLAIRAMPRRPHVAVAHELAVWAVDPPRPIGNVAATYRTFLGRARDLAAPERLADDGTPLDVAAPSNVTQLRRPSVRDARNEQIERGLAAARAEGLIP